MRDLAAYLKSILKDQSLCIELSKPEVVENVDGFEPNKDLIFIKWIGAHTLPLVNLNGWGLSFKGVKKTLHTVMNKSVNLDHKVFKNLGLVELPEDKEGRPISLHIGSVVGYELEGADTIGDVTVPNEKQEIRIITALYRHEPIVQAIHKNILDAHISKKEADFKASIEYNRAGSFEDDLIFDGEKVFTFENAPDDLREKFFAFEREPIPHNGKIAGLVIGGDVGVEFSGLGITVDPADTLTRPIAFAASKAKGRKGEASRMLASLLSLGSIKGDCEMNKEIIDFLCSLGVIPEDQAKLARASMAILNQKDNGSDDKKLDKALENLTSVLNSIGSADAELVIQKKVDEKLASGDFIAKKDLEEKINEVIEKQKGDGELFTKDDLEKEVENRLKSINAINSTVESWFNKLKEEGIDTDKLDTELQKSGQGISLKQQLVNMAGEENSEERFTKSIGFFKTFAKGADALNTNSGSSAAPPVNNAQTDKMTGPNAELLNNFL